VVPLSQSEAVGGKFAMLLGCQPDDLACLRSVDASNILNTLPNAGWEPTIDNVEMSQTPIAYIQQGNINNIGGLILGTNLNEWSAFVCDSMANMTIEEYEKSVYQAFGQKLGDVMLQIYPASKYSAPVQAFIDLVSDDIFKCPTRRAARGVAATTTLTYLYSFQHIPSFSPNDCYNVAHAFELPFLFKILNISLNIREKRLSENMINYWTMFATTVKQQSRLVAPEWPQYHSDSDENLILDLQISKETGYRKLQCDFWDTIQDYQQVLHHRQFQDL